MILPGASQGQTSEKNPDNVTIEDVLEESDEEVRFRAVVTTPIIQGAGTSQAAGANQKKQGVETSGKEPEEREISAMQEELDASIKKQQELRGRLKRAREQNSKSNKAVGEKETPVSMTEDAIAKYLEANYRVTKHSAYDYLETPYSVEIAEYQYPENYTSPKFKTYGGKGNAREHVNRFMSAMNAYAQDENLCMKEFPKSLTDNAFTWYDNLKPGSISSWPAMIQLFLKKFYSAQRRITAIDLGRCTQRLGEEIGKFITRFRDFALECHEDIPEERLVEICIRGMDTVFRLNLTNFRFQTFMEVEEAAARISDCADIMSAGVNAWQSHSVNAASSEPGNFRGRGGHTTFGSYRGGQSGRRGGRTDGGRNPPPPLPCSKEQILGLLDQWIANKEETLPPVITEPTE